MTANRLDCVLQPSLRPPIDGAYVRPASCRAAELAFSFGMKPSVLRGATFVLRSRRPRLKGARLRRDQASLTPEMIPPVSRGALGWTPGRVSKHAKPMQQHSETRAKAVT